MATMIGDGDVTNRITDAGSQITLFNKKQSDPFYTVPAHGRRQIVAERPLTTYWSSCPVIRIARKKL